MEARNTGRQSYKPKYTRAQFEAAANKAVTKIVFKEIHAETPLNLVTYALGTYQLGDLPMRARWNYIGECRTSSNRRLPKYDLEFDAL